MNSKQRRQYVRKHLPQLKLDFASAIVVGDLAQRDINAIKYELSNIENKFVHYQNARYYLDTPTKESV